MARIVPKLNLNKNPEAVDNNSLIFAKNIRLNANGLSADLGFEEVITQDGIKGIIPYNTKFYILTSGYVDGEKVDKIFEYDEYSKQLRYIPTKWQYSGGKIDGECSVNLRGDILLTIAEQAAGVPIKTINITEHLKSDFRLQDIDESFYTQAPEVPLFNLSLIGHYSNPIPAGVYQFFIRYEIYDNFYTDWFPASKELYAGYEKSLRTTQGGLKFVDVKLDSSISFKLRVDKVYETASKFKSFQLGFILSHDDEVYGRAYKHYDIDTNYIDFDYDPEYIEEVDVKDFLYPTYDLYNVGNLTEFKNKLYISNYEETDFNVDSANTDVEEFVEGISVDFNYAENTSVAKYSDETPITLEFANGVPYITKIDEQTIPSILHEIFSELAGDTYDGILFNLVEASLDFITRKHITVSYNKTITSAPISDYIDPEHPDDPPEINEHIQLYHDSVVPTEPGSASNVIDAMVENANYISVAMGNFRPDLTPGIGYDHYTLEYKTVVGDTVYTCFVAISFYTDIYNLIINFSIQNNYTLVPHQAYKFYVHFVTKKGEISNGYLIQNYDENTDTYVDEFLIEEDANKPNAAIYPIFNFAEALPSEFKACFISILHSRNTVAQVFDIHNITGGVTFGDCLELDLALYSALSDIAFIADKTDGTQLNNQVDYRASYDNENYTTFGASGKCVFEEALSADDITAINSKGFILIPYVANSKYALLTKCTPWIIPEQNDTYDNYTDLNLLGYLCTVKKPLDNFEYYYSGTEIYRKQVSVSAGRTSLTLEEIEENTTTHEFEEYRYHLDSNSFIIYSNFNLNFISLRETIIDQRVTKQVEGDTSSTNNTRHYIYLGVNSYNLSEVYELVSMYKSYTRKLYSVSDKTSIVKFTNTIRSSQLEGDEAKVYTYKFPATDYYNVPTDKGIIVNLIAVGDNILVHTQDSIYKFSGSNSLTAQGGEDVQMKESEPFDTGIQELFGSEYGYAGLRSKDHQILSEFGYTFWDADSMRIYLYTGNAQMKVLSDDISKLLKRGSIDNIYLADDYYNNRIFFCIDFSDGITATLSYDFVAKSFISLHDFKFTWSFKTKTHCYFVHKEHPQSGYNHIFKVGDSIGSYLALAFVDELYPQLNYACIVDVIYNSNYETIKTCNAISWVCNKIISNFAELDYDNPKTLMVAEEYYENNSPEVRYKGEFLRIYTDSCATNLIDITDRSNDESLTVPTILGRKVNRHSYDKPRYNLGKWTFNYFRNILNTGNNTGADDNSLIYGKYIIARFIFSRDINFKFEDVTINVSNDYNV